MESNQDFDAFQQPFSQESENDNSRVISDSSN